MNTRKTIINSLNKSFKLIKSIKYLFVVLFFTQLLFMGIISAVFIFYAIDIGQNAQAVLQPMEQLGSEADLFSMVSTSANVYQAYNAMMASLTILLLLTYLIYVVLNGINWDLTNMIITKKCRWGFYLTRFGILSLIFLLPLYIIFNLLSKMFISAGLSASVTPFLLILILIIAYFMHISFSLIDQWKEIKQIKEILKKTFRIGIKHAKVIVPTYIFALFSLIVTFALLYAALEAPFLLLFAACILFVITINWARLYFLVTMREFI